MSPTDALEVAVRARLVASDDLTDLVPAEHIGDRHGRPAHFPSIIFGEGQEVPAAVSFDRRHVWAYVTLHVWDRSPGLGTVKTIAHAVRTALHGVPLELDGFALLDESWTGTRFLRDPSGDVAHAVMTFEALVEEPLLEGVAP
ncbi:DUF3168 domain-containing protein [Methylobacterium oryzisoli]|uniref:DUF3168 domain-containing protein n=1 Tax=Methylobacterium oryzisoli TaxID=3385502 RepID=UPI00397E0A5B